MYKDSIANDIMYNTSRGQIKTIKHVQLALGVKRKTGSKKVIEWLNRFGHCISYAEVNAAETKSTMDESKRYQKNTTYVPSVITPSTFVTFIWDNCDHNCELIFDDTLHCMNGIIVQRKEISSYARVELTHEAVSAIENTTKIRALRPLEKNVTTTMLVKRKE